MLEQAWVQLGEVVLLGQKLWMLAEEPILIAQTVSDTCSVDKKKQKGEL